MENPTSVILMIFPLKPPCVGELPLPCLITTGYIFLVNISMGSNFGTTFPHVPCSLYLHYIYIYNSIIYTYIYHYVFPSKSTSKNPWDTLAYPPHFCHSQLSWETNELRKLQNSKLLSKWHAPMWRWRFLSDSIPHYGL